ncbi:MAG: CHY zinc finger protein [Humibacter sp.]
MRPVKPVAPVKPAVPAVLGPTVDDQTRCIHYRTPLDVIAIRFACCDEYYPCHLCHSECADHVSRPWPADARDEHAVLCGVCWTELTIAEYLATDACPACHAEFNPRCALHYPLYFA